MTLKTLLTNYRKGILLALSFVAIEKLAWIIEPTVFGQVIDAMIARVTNPAGASPALPIMIWVSIFGINSIAGAVRRSRGEKIFLRIYNDLAAGLGRKVESGSISPPRAAARAELSREVVNFYQYRVPDIIEQVIDIGGATIALTLFDWRLGATCITILLPVFFLGRLYNRKVSTMQKGIHDQQEDVYQIFASGNADQVDRYYATMAGWKQRIANWGAWNFGILRLCLLAIFLVILYVAIDLDDFTTGNIYAIAAYVWTFITSSEYVPEQLESITSVSDISERLEAEYPGEKQTTTTTV
jgi:ABC-type multidrug transport system fused ATPase/permease subunit